MDRYKYNPATGEYLGVHVCQKSPLEKDVWVYPSYTSEADPSKIIEARLKDEKTIIKNGKWINVKDYIGKQYFYKADNEWIESEIISELGITRDTVVVDKYQDQAIEKSELTGEQAEEIRFQGLTSDAKTKEKEMTIESALSQSIYMRSKLEIEGSSAEVALTESQTFYQAELEKIDLKYVEPLLIKQ